MTRPVKNNQGKSASLTRLDSRLELTLQHLKTVDKALREARTSNNGQIINHSITRNFQSTIQSLYTHLNEYLKSILWEMFQKRPLQIVDKVQDVLQFQEIVRIGSYEAVCNHMVDKIFRKLENQSRNTNSLIEKILDKTGVKSDKKILDDAMHSIEIRHLIVHNSGQMDRKFAEAHSHRYKDAKDGNKLMINIKVATDGIDSVSKLCSEIDHGLCAGGYVEV